MEIIAISIHHENVPISIREKLRIPKDRVGHIHKEIQQLKSVLENVFITTCHRIELYAVCTQVHIGRYTIRNYLAQLYQIELEELDQWLEVYVGNEAIERCFLLGSGVLSKVIGETQILGQLKHSWWIASENKAVGSILNRLFKQVVMFAKKVHDEIRINEHPSSSAYQAVQLMKKHIGEGYSMESLLLLGAGDMGRLVYEYVVHLGWKRLDWVNKSMDIMQQVSEGAPQSVSIHGLDYLKEGLTKASVMISCVQVEQPIILKEMVHSQAKLFIDLSFPRSIHPHVGHKPNLTLYNIDDIEDRLSENDQKRQEKVLHIKQLAQLEVNVYLKWLQQLGIHQTLAKLQDKTDGIYEQTKDSLFRKLPNLDEHEQKIIAKHLKSIRNQILKAPIKQLKEMALEEDSQSKIELFEKIFDLKNRLF